LSVEVLVGVVPVQAHRGCGATYFSAGCVDGLQENVAGLGAHEVLGGGVDGRVAGVKAKGVPIHVDLGVGSVRGDVNAGVDLGHDGGIACCVVKQRLDEHNLLKHGPVKVICGIRGTTGTVKRNVRVSEGNSGISVGVGEGERAGGLIANFVDPLLIVDCSQDVVDICGGVVCVLVNEFSVGVSELESTDALHVVVFDVESEEIFNGGEVSQLALDVVEELEALFELDNVECIIRVGAIKNWVNTGVGLVLVAKHLGFTNHANITDKGIGLSEKEIVELAFDKALNVGGQAVVEPHIFPVVGSNLCLSPQFGNRADHRVFL